MKAIVPSGARALSHSPKALPADRHPFHVYLRRLSEGSRRTMRQAADVIAQTLTEGKLDAEAASAAVRSFAEVLKFLQLEIKTEYLKRRYGMDKTDPIDL